jgi:hypothetical protein
VTGIARLAFGALVLATLAAFFVTQKLKSSPPLVVRPWVSEVFSPDPDARVRRARVSFWIVRGDDVSVSIVDGGGRIVRTLLDGYRLPERVRITRWWDGRTESGAVVPDGRYRVRIALIHQGRTIDLPRAIRVDTRPPRPRVASIEPRAGDRPAFLPQEGIDAVTVRVAGTERRRARLVIWRTDVTPPRRVGRIVIPFDQDTARWDGTLGGRPAPAGTYLMGVLVADRPGNVGTFPRVLPPRAGRVPAPAGVTIRYLAASPPLAPVTAGERTTVLVDARGRPYRWALRRLGAPAVLASGRGSDVRLRLRVPRGQSGLHVLTLVAGEQRATVPLVVGAAKPRAVLVVLPALTWQGLSRVDDDGDGMPDTLADGPRAAVRLARPFTGLPAGLASREGALLRFLDDDLLRYDLTTDAALATGAGPTLEGRRGVVLAGDARWLTPELRTLLRGYVRRGGRVWSLGVDALRRTATLRDGRLVEPSPPRPTDALGARPRQPLEQVEGTATATMTTYLDDPAIDLFAGTGGAFPGYGSYEVLASLAPTAELLSAAGPVAETPVIAAWRLGDGLAIHTGLPELAEHALAGDLDAAALVRRLWAILARPS